MLLHHLVIAKKTTKTMASFCPSPSPGSVGSMKCGYRLSGHRTFFSGATGSPALGDGNLTNNNLGKL